MTEYLNFLSQCLEWPLLPYSILMVLVLLYWLMVIIGALHLDFLHLDLDVATDVDVDVTPGFHVDAPPVFLTLGLVPLRFLNIGRVPLMIWLSAFSVSAWTLTHLADHFTTHSTDLVILDAFVLGLFSAKLITQPLRGIFSDPEPPNPAKDLVGKTCEITSLEATSNSGQASFDTDGAPLLLTVHTTGERLSKGAQAEIVGYDPDQNIYVVAARK